MTFDCEQPRIGIYEEMKYHFVNQHQMKEMPKFKD